MRQLLLLLPLTVFVPVISPAAESDRDTASLAARPSPEWVTGGVMYQIQPRAFTPEGTLKAATARLARVAEMGVDIIYICPVFVADDDQPDAVLSFLRRTPDDEILSVLNLSNRTVKVRITFPEPTQWSSNTLIADSAKVDGDGSGPTLKLEGFGYLVAKRK